MSNWNGLDFFIFLIFFLNTVLGMSRGASKEIISMMCLCAALIFTIRFTLPITIWLNSSPLISSVISNRFVGNFLSRIGSGPVTTEMLAGFSYSLSLLICFVSIFSVTEAAINYSGFVEMFTFPWAIWSRKVGAVLGCTRGYVVNLFFISVLMHSFTTDTGTTVGNMLSGSWFVRLFQNAVMQLDSLVAGQQVEQYQQIFKDKDLYNVQDIYRTIPPTPVDGAVLSPTPAIEPAPANGGTSPVFSQ